MKTEERRPPSFTEAEADWLCTLLEERYGLPITLRFDANNRWHIGLPASEQTISIVSDPATFTQSCLNLPFCTWGATNDGWEPMLELPLPMPGLATTPSPTIEQTKTGYTIHYDILGLTYWMLTRQEEIVCADLDTHGRFPAKASHAVEHGYLERPVVDEWLHILGKVIQHTWPGVKLKQHKFSAKVSHDVDNPSRYGFGSWRKLTRSMAVDILKQHNLRALSAPWIRLNTRSRLNTLDVHNTFDWLMNESEKRGLTSAFYFICNQRGTPYDSNYDLEHPAIRDLIRRIHERGHEIGLHPSYATYLEPEQIKYEADRLRRVCAEEGVTQQTFGGRMHYLQWRQPDTLRAWEKADMTYDSTMTYADAAGFRCGTCFEYPAFDPVEQKMLNLRIRPLICMEGSVFGANYMNLGVTDAAQEKMLELKNKCRAVNGCFTLLWHNSRLKTEQEFTMYQSILDT